MTVIFATMLLIAGALALISMQKANAQSNIIHNEQQQKLGQPSNCRNNATCTDISLISFISALYQDKNDTKLNYYIGQPNPIKDYVQKDTTPFLLPFP